VRTGVGIAVDHDVDASTFTEFHDCLRGTVNHCVTIWVTQGRGMLGALGNAAVELAGLTTQSSY
jgi:hypothetical protein